MMRIAAEFGFTPESRSRITTPPHDEEAGLFDVLERDDANPEKT
jgi:phage terminase small subunit